MWLETTGIKMAKRMTISQLLDSVPMGGSIMVFGPYVNILEEANNRNSSMRGEWFDVAAVIMQNRTAVVIARREMWSLTTPEVVLNAQRFFRKMEW